MLGVLPCCTDPLSSVLYCLRIIRSRCAKFGLPARWPHGRRPISPSIAHCCTPTARVHPLQRPLCPLSPLPARPKVYSEVYRVLKPGAIFMTYE